MLKALMVACYGLASILLIILAVVSGMATITTTILVVMKFTGHMDRSWLTVFTPIAAVVAGWIACAIFGLIGLVCQVCCKSK